MATVPVHGFLYTSSFVELYTNERKVYSIMATSWVHSYSYGYTMDPVH